VPLVIRSFNSFSSFVVIIFCVLYNNRRWYILLGTFVIFPLTFNVGLGCRFLNVGFEDEDEIQSFGAFNVAIYDPETRGNNKFLGCVGLSQFWQEETNYDLGFTIVRVTSALMMGFTTLATLICVCLQCFSKSGKSHLWSIMRVCYIGATISQAVMYSIFASDMCKTDDDDDDSNFDAFIALNLTNKKCSPGHTGITGVINFALLFGMVLATFNSLPPRNPVFQCWGSDMEDDDLSDDGSTSEEDSVMRKWKELGHSIDQDDSVSLFGGSRMSRKSRKSVKGDEESQKTKGSLPSKFEKYAVAEEGSVASAKSSKSAVSKKSHKSSTSVSTARSIAKYLKKKAADDNKSVTSSKSNKSAISKAVHEAQLLEPSDSKVSASDFGLKSMSSASGSTLEVTNFVLQLISMTELKEGGRRVKIADLENQVEIVDEYPKKKGGDIESSPSSDIAAVRTEFYELGSRTTKEITHSDGSKTVVTTILVENGLENATMASQDERPRLLEPPVELMHSAGSIDSYKSSKYEVVPCNSSVTTYKGLGKKKEVLGQGDLCLSVGTMSVKSAK
jgi:hypothetical protein